MMKIFYSRKQDCRTFVICGSLLQFCFIVLLLLSSPAILPEPNTFSYKGNPIAENRIKAVLQSIPVSAGINLAERFLASALQARRGVGIFHLEHRRPSMGGIADNQIAAPFPVFAVGFHPKPAPAKIPARKAW